MKAKILNLLAQYKILDIDNIINFAKFNNYLVSHHSTSIEGSTLTYVETSVLLEDDLTPKGKPLVHTLMQKDHYNALLFALDNINKSIYTPTFICQINAKVMHSTGQIYYTALGDVDATQGQYRKGNVFAGQTSFVNYAKVEPLMLELCEYIKQNLNINNTIEQLIFSFIVHYKLVYIHPHYDGNGRTSRLLMNSLQAYFKLPLAIVFVEDKVEYIQALIDAKQQDDITIFIDFMFTQYYKHLNNVVNSIA
jgi:Fic family protein